MEKVIFTLDVPAIDSSKFRYDADACESISDQYSEWLERQGTDVLLATLASTID